MKSESLEGQHLEGTPYRLHQLLGAGAHGEVYLGEHVALGKRVVIKLIRVALVSRADIVVRFRREARVLVGIEHPAIIEPTDLGETKDGRTFFVMGYVEGTSFREVLRQRIVLPPREACLLMAETAEGLHAAHQAGVIHRDIKPENLLLTAKGHVKVLDFGIAKAMQEAGATGTQTANGFVLGTPRYMAPEQAKGETLSPATDLYALTCVLFELLTGTPFAEGDDARDLIRQHAFSEPPTLSQRTHKTFAPELEALVVRGVRKDPRQRFSSGAECAEALRQVVSALDRANLPSAPAPKLAQTSPQPPQDQPTEVDGVDAKPTIKMDQPYLPAGALPTGAFGADTRAVRSEALVMGTATTDQAPRVSDGPETTAKTELLSVLSSSTASSLGGSSTEDSYQVTSPVAKKRSSGVSLAIVVPMAVLAVGAVVAVGLIFTRGGGDPGAAKKERTLATASAAATKEAVEPTLESTAKSAASAIASEPTVVASAKVEKPEKSTTGTPVATAKTKLGIADSMPNTKPSASIVLPTAKALGSAKPGKMGGGTEDRE
jgi:serine/threonine protein kinase